MPRAEIGRTYTCGDSAIATLKRLGYTWCGGELWKPPIGKKPEWLNDKPVFTQAMADADELPPIGSECLMNVSRDSAAGVSGYTAGEHAGKKVYICSTFTNRRGLDLAAYFGVDGNFGGVAAALAFGYIDTRTDKEKLVSELVSSLRLNLNEYQSPEMIVDHVKQGVAQLLLSPQFNITRNDTK